ncbi:MAG: hypothetical protein RLZZ524_1387, partial [Pseudomonadota bacterium]
MTMDANIVITRRDDVLLMPSRALTVAGLAPPKGTAAPVAVPAASAASAASGAAGASTTPTRQLPVWAVDADGRLRRPVVTLGVAGGERTEVIDGLAEGDTLVVAAVEQGAGLLVGRAVRVASTAPATPAAPR